MTSTAISAHKLHTEEAVETRVFQRERLRVLGELRV